MEAHLDLYLRIMFGRGILSRAQREMIAIVVSATNKCEYCVAHHSAALRKYVTDGQFVNQLAKDIGSVKLGSKERKMLEYAIKLTERPDSISMDDIRELRLESFGDEEILHIALIVSYFNFVNRLANGLGVSLEPDQRSGYKY